MVKSYWKCDFEGRNGEIVSKMIYAKTTTSAFKHCFQMGMRIGMSPKYETLQNATEEEVKELKKLSEKELKKTTKKVEASFTSTFLCLSKFKFKCI